MTIEASLTSENTGNWVRRCLTVLMALSRCPLLHSNTNARALIIAVGQLDIAKLQGVIGTSAGTGCTRLGGRKRSLRVESEVVGLYCFHILYCMFVQRYAYLRVHPRNPAQKESGATLYQLKWMILASLLTSSDGDSHSAVSLLSAYEQCYLAHAVADAIPSIGHRRTLIPVFLTLAQLMPMLVKQHVALNDGSSNMQSTANKWPDLTALLECSWATYLDLPRSQQAGYK